MKVTNLLGLLLWIKKLEFLGFTLVNIDRFWRAPRALDYGASAKWPHVHTTLENVFICWTPCLRSVTNLIFHFFDFQKWRFFQTFFAFLARTWNFIFLLILYHYGPFRWWISTRNSFQIIELYILIFDFELTIIHSWHNTFLFNLIQICGFFEFFLRPMFWA